MFKRTVHFIICIKDLVMSEDLKENEKLESVMGVINLISKFNESTQQLFNLNKN